MFLRVDAREPDLEVYDDEAIEQLLKSTQTIKAEIAELEGTMKTSRLPIILWRMLNVCLCV